MTNAVYLIDAQPDASPKVKEYAGLLREQIRISQRIISDLLSTVHSTAPVREPVDVAVLIDEYLRQAAIPSTIRVERDVGPGLPMPVVDRDQIGRILMNLITNAIQAMDGAEGTLAIRAAAGDGRLSIEVADTGPGIPADVAVRIFEPLFTTKARGIGLGLSVALAMAQANGGNLRLRSSNDRGACFVLDLPAADARDEQAHATPPPEVVGAAPA
jgi:signal transduction histidine kinase